MKKLPFSFMALTLCIPSLLLSAEFQGKKAKPEPIDQAMQAKIKEAAQRIQIQDKASGNEVASLKKEILEGKEWALGKIYETLGLYLPDGRTISVILTSEANAQYNGTTQRGKGGTPIVTMYLTNILKMKRGKDVFMHELIHAIQLSYMNQAQQKALPHSFYEGLAFYAVDEGEQYIEEHLKLAYQGDAQKLIANLKGLESYRSPTEYVEGYLAVHYLAEKYGTPKVHQFAKEVTFDKKNYKAAIESATGTSWAQFQKEARDYTIEYLKKIGKGK